MHKLFEIIFSRLSGMLAIKLKYAFMSTDNNPGVFDVIGAHEKQGASDVNKIIALCLIVSIVAIVASVMAYLFNFWGVPVAKTADVWGQLGDYLGGVLNPIFGFLSMVLLCYTLIIQFKESKESARLGAVQSFENMLFELIRLHKDNLASIYYVDNIFGRELKGKDCFAEYCDAVVHFFNASHGNNEPLLERIVGAYDVFYNEQNNKYNVGHYFRTLYLTFKHIDEAMALGDEDKIKYAKIVRAQLSVPETVLLFFNGLHCNGENFKRYVEKYALLQELDVNDIMFKETSPDLVKNLYSQSAYSDQ